MARVSPGSARSSTESCCQPLSLTVDASLTAPLTRLATRATIVGSTILKNPFTRAVPVSTRGVTMISPAPAAAPLRR